MDIDKSERQYTVKGGRTILGRLFEYQKETGASLKDIMKMPYIHFALSMMDAPYIDTDKKKTDATVKKAETEEDQLKALQSFF